MPHQEDIRLMAHLMRRAGFGDPREELEERAPKATKPWSRSFCIQSVSRP